MKATKCRDQTVISSCEALCPGAAATARGGGPHLKLYRAGHTCADAVSIPNLSNPQIVEFSQGRADLLRRPQQLPEAQSSGSAFQQSPNTGASEAQVLRKLQQHLL